VDEDPKCTNSVSERTRVRESGARKEREKTKKEKVKFPPRLSPSTISTTPRPGIGKGCQGHIEKEYFAMGVGENFRKLYEQQLKAFKRTEDSEEGSRQASSSRATRGRLQLSEN